MKKQHINRTVLNNKKLLNIFLLCLTTLCLNGQPSIVWEKSLGGTGMDRGFSIQQLSDGNYIAVGVTSSSDGDVTTNHGDYDAWILKLNSTGGIIWEKSLGGTFADNARHVQETSDGGYIVVGTFGSLVSGNHGGDDYWVIKLDNSGTILWDKKLGGSSWERGQYIQETSDGGYIVSGTSESTDGDVTGNHGDKDYWVVKLNSVGNIVWEQSLGGSNAEMLGSCQETNDGGYIVAGSSFSLDGDITTHYGENDIWLVKLNSQGGIVWEKTLGGTGWETTAIVEVMSDGGYTVVGASSSNNVDLTHNNGFSDFWTVRLDSIGTITWQVSLGSTGEDYPQSIQETSDGGCIITGAVGAINGDVIGNGTGGGYCWLIKLTSTGTLDWQKSLGGTSSEMGAYVQEINNGDYILIGSSSSTDGDVTTNNGNYDYWVVKLSSVLGLSEVDESVSIDLFPNPALDLVTLKKDVKLTNAHYVVYNTMGQAILSGDLTEEYTKIDTRDLLSGLYHVEIKTLSTTQTIPFVKQ
ncbi:T9SS type A sorting domain-containing protein [Aureispira anguillae]|uniref:T9SS type A sorting domain-containing protein n=1 Tax=Aureispira anguillae TaxID=2864201 RepID=A0A915YJH7_9BACT|nr:T9SS type A sorting domain-containing protein [Aureispira anguillae]BDS14360.1 T9SS type A sorting domain-containing protein [Aureispira anguillae]